MSSSSSAMIEAMTAGNRKNEATAMAPTAAMSTSHCRASTQNPVPAQSRTQATSPSPAQSRANQEASQTATKVTKEYSSERLKTRRNVGSKDWLKARDRALSMVEGFSPPPAHPQAAPWQAVPDTQRRACRAGPSRLKEAASPGLSRR